MTLPNYGIPELAASQQLLTDTINANVQDLANVAIAAVSPVVEAVQANALDLQKIQNTLNRSFGQAVGANAGQLQSVAPLNVTSAPTPRDVLDPTDPPTCGAPVATPPIYNPGNVVTDVTGSVCPAFGPAGPPSFITINNTQVNLSGTYGHTLTEGPSAYYYDPHSNTVYQVRPAPPPPPPAPPAPPAQTASPPPSSSPPPGAVGIGPQPSPSGGGLPVVYSNLSTYTGTVACIGINPTPPTVPAGESLLQWLQSQGGVAQVTPLDAGGSLSAIIQAVTSPSAAGGTDSPYNIVVAAKDSSAVWYVNTCNAYGVWGAYSTASPPPPPPPPSPPPTPPPSPVPLPPPVSPPPPKAPECIPICLVPPPGQSPPPPSSPPGTPPKPTIPPSPPAQTPPALSPQKFYLIFPLPGTPDWCAAAVNINNWLAGIGQKVFTALDSGLENIEAFFLDLAQPPQDSEWSIFGTIFTGIMRDLVGPIAGMYANVLHALRTVVQSASSQFVFGSPDRSLVALGSVVLIGIWNAIKNTEIGSEVWILSKTKIGDAYPEIDQIIHYLFKQNFPIEVPSPPEAMEAFLQGQIDRSTYECWLLIHGCHPDLYQPILTSRRDRLTAYEAIQYGRRTGLPDSTIAANLRNIGWINVAEATARVQLYDELPTQADFLHYLQRNVYNREYVAQYDLLNGFEDKYWANFGTQLHAIGITKERAALDFAAHWVLPSPTQMHEFIYRLRPDKPGVANPFTLQDFENLLAEQDVSPRAAKWFVETAYRVPALGYLRDMYRQNVITDDQLRGYHQDLGYTEADSSNFVEIDRIQKVRMRASQGHGWNPAAIASAYSIRQMTPETVVLQMAILGFDAEEAGELMERADVELQRSVFVRARSRALTSTVTQVSNAIKVGIINATTAAQTLIAAGWPADYAQNLANSVSISAGVDRIKQVVAAVRKAFLAGEIDSLTSQQALAQSGITAAAQQDYLSIWTLQNTPRRKRRTAANIVNDVATNQMSTDEALVRLLNLGYDDADSRLYMADAQRKISANQAKMLASTQRADKATQANLARIARAAQAQAKSAIKRLEKIAPVGKLQKWAKLGLISHNNFLLRMELYGFDQLTAETYWKEACSAKSAQCSETQTNGIPIGPGEPNIPGP